MARAWRTDRWAPLFFTIWGGQIFSLLGSRIVQFALVWWMTKTTGSAVVLTTATIAALVPGVVLGPFIGPLIDRWSRRRVMIAADGAIALATVLLAVLFALGVVEIWHVYLIMFARSVGGAFHWPSMQASTTLMVPERHYSRIAGLNQSLQGASNLVGPAAGAFLIEVLPMQGVLAVDVLTAAIAIAPLLLIAIPQPSRVVAGRSSFRRDLREGLHFLAGWPGLMGVAGIAALLNFLLAPAGSLLPLLVTKHFGGGAFHLAGLQMATGLGVIAGGLLLTAWGGFKRRIVTALLGVVFLGAGAVLLGLTPATLFSVAVFASLLIGLMQPIANGSIMAALQASTPADMQGRLFSLTGSVSSAMMPLGLTLAGQLAERFSPGTWFVIGGTASVLLGGLGLFVPSIVHLEEQGEKLAAQRADSAGSPALTDVEPADSAAAQDAS
jgi:DHA3 family macrolide efflux protein-like MFS transporter